MPAPRQPTPAELKDILVSHGWTIYKEDSYNWLLTNGDEYLSLPKRLKTVPFEILYACADAAGLSLPIHRDAAEA